MDKEYTGLKILAIISLLGGLILAIGGLYYISIGGAVAEAGEDSILGIIALIPVGVTLVAMGGVMFVVGLILAFISYKLYRHVRWAFWLYFVVTILGVVVSIYGGSLVGVVLGGIIVVYLWTIHKSFMEGGDHRIVRSG